MSLKENNKLWWLPWAFLTPVITTLDIFTKYLVHNNLPFHRPVQILGNFLRFTFCHNDGMSFSLMSGYFEGYRHIVITVLNLIVIGALIMMMLNIPKTLKEGKVQRIAPIVVLSIIGGAFGNIIDRLFFFNPVGKYVVVDFIDFGIGKFRWAPFNVADSFVVVGAITLGIIFMFFAKPPEPVEAQIGETVENAEDKETQVEVSEGKEESKEK